MVRLDKPRLRGLANLRVAGCLVGVSVVVVVVVFFSSSSLFRSNFSFCGEVCATGFAPLLVVSSVGGLFSFSLDADDGFVLIFVFVFVCVFGFVFGVAVFTVFVSLFCLTTFCFGFEVVFVFGDAVFTVFLSLVFFDAGAAFFSAFVLISAFSLRLFVDFGRPVCFACGVAGFLETFGLAGACDGFVVFFGLDCDVDGSCAASVPTVAFGG
mmetsp:Transcript_24422/g.39361  ORF Transcript_24422/g.39361 Transcript_24422/m.39361 type:complete len:211 (+) Transcript_24422:558-1190(+)